MPAVLLVDDDATAVRTWSLFLRLEGFRVESAGNGGDAIHMVSARRFDAIVVDYRLPDMTGLEVLRYCCRHAIRAPTLFVTGFGSTALAVEAMKAGAADYTEKPLFCEDLVERIRAMLRCVAAPGDASPVLPPLPRVADDRVAAVLESIDRNLARPSSIPQLASAVRTSVSRLRQVFRRETGVSIRTFRNQRRVEHAAAQLVATVDRVSEIAARVGFDPAHLDHAFRRQFGESPRDYRLRNRAAVGSDK